MALRYILRRIRNPGNDSTGHMSSADYGTRDTSNEAGATGRKHSILDTCSENDNRTDDVNNNTTPLDIYQTLPTSTPYDIVIRINSLTALKTSGWEIILGQNAKNIDLEVTTSDDARGVIVAVLGAYNRGKSFLINQLCKINLPSDNLIYTEGISMTAGKDNAENIIFIDTAGTDTAIEKGKLQDKKATEALLKEIALHLCSYAIIVVNRLRATDQSYIDQVVKHCKSVGGSKSILVVHNLSDVESETDVASVVQREIETLFDAKPESINLPTAQNFEKVNFYSSSQDGMEIRHFVFAKHGSPAAHIWNQQSIGAMMGILQTATANRRNLDVISEIISFVNNRLPQILNESNKQTSVDEDSNQEKLHVEQHINKPYIVLTRRKGLDNLDEDPDELEISPKLLYDDAGYFIGISLARNEGWKPRYSLYDTVDDIHAMIELAGFKKGVARVRVVEQAIIIEGERTDLKNTLSSPTVLQEEIPTGLFTLEIPLKTNIDLSKVKMERDEGLFRITCSKKKAEVVQLDE